MVYYRVDYRNFTKKYIQLDKAFSMSPYEHEYHENEKIIESARPKKRPNRSKSCFLFNNKQEAVKFMTHNINNSIYKIKIQKIKSIFKGDYVMVSRIRNMPNNHNGNVLKECIKYWNPNTKIQRKEIFGYFECKIIRKYEFGEKYINSLYNLLDAKHNVSTHDNGLTKLLKKYKIKYKIINDKLIL